MPIEPINHKIIFDHFHKLISSYLNTTNNLEISNTYEFLLREIEYPLLEAVMQYTQGNQVKAAQILGMNRGTLRRKLYQHFGNRYFNMKK